MAKLLEHLDEPHRTMVSLIAAMRLRIGELLALRPVGLGSRRQRLGGVRESVFERKFQPPRRRAVAKGSNAQRRPNATASAQRA
jgi:hypothetical protein